MYSDFTESLHDFIEVLARLQLELLVDNERHLFAT
jgi:hypothetical protein